jgi:predicted small metal-binding protein
MGMSNQKYTYKCSERGDIQCDFELTSEDPEEVRTQVAEHHRDVHREEDYDPKAVDALLEMQRLEA